MSGGREGRAGALLMGLSHGVYCAGCCWFLMALLFVAGVMNMWWVAILSGFVLAEKIALKGMWLGRFGGVFLAVWGIWLIITPGHYSTFATGAIFTYFLRAKFANDLTFGGRLVQTHPFLDLVG